MRRWIVGYLWVLSLAGCELTPPGPGWDYPTTTVEGRITLADEPVARGWVLLQPFAGTIGNHVILPIAEDGTYRSDQVPIGRLQVRIFLPRGLTTQIVSRYPSLVARLKLIREPGSPLEIQTLAERVVRFDFDLLRGG